MKEIKAEEVKEVEVTTEENTETEVATEEVKESKLKAFGTKVKSGLQKHGKNIAKGAVSPEMAMDGWMRSDGHRANILNASYTKISVSCYYDGYTYYWVQNFAY